MADIPKEAVAAVKLTRADAVKLVASEMIEQAAQDVAACERRVNAARAAFRSWAHAVALKQSDTALRAACDAVGSDFDMLTSACTFRVYDDGTDSGTVAQVVFSDHQASFEARLRLVVDVMLSGTGERLRDAWAAALVDLKNARERDQRMGAMKADAREALIKAALAGEEGAAVVAAVRALAASIRSSCDG